MEEQPTGGVVRRNGGLQRRFVLIRNRARELIEERRANAVRAGLGIDVNREPPPGGVQLGFPNRADADQAVVCFDDQGATIPARLIDCRTMGARFGESGWVVGGDGGEQRGDRRIVSHLQGSHLDGRRRFAAHSHV